MAADFVDRKVDLILAISDPMARTAKSASSTIPIVFFIGGDPSPVDAPEPDHGVVISSLFLRRRSVVFLTGYGSGAW